MNKWLRRSMTCGWSSLSALASCPRCLTILTATIWKIKVKKNSARLVSNFSTKYSILKSDLTWRGSYSYFYQRQEMVRLWIVTHSNFALITLWRRARCLLTLSLTKTRMALLSGQSQRSALTFMRKNLKKIICNKSVRNMKKRQKTGVIPAVQESTLIISHQHSDLKKKPLTLCCNPKPDPNF